jgi:hypothetical protein
METMNLCKAKIKVRNKGNEGRGYIYIYIYIRKGGKKEINYNKRERN